MKIVQTAIKPSRGAARSGPAEALANEYVQRAARFVPCSTELFATEAALFLWLERQAARTTPVLILLDSRGRQFSSEQIARHVGEVRDSGAQMLVFAIGPADGWSAEARARASLLLSLGAITLPHELARAVLAEQIYRALTILAGHPYHSGH